MCPIPGPPVEAIPDATGPRSTCFTCSRLNATTFAIVEADKWDELPIIYAKVYASMSVLVLIDTGCGGAAKDKSGELTSLRAFIETCAVTDNGGRPLNPAGEKDYVVICSHCHFDHIGTSECQGSRGVPEY